MIFQNRGRPQGNINKTRNRDFLRSRQPARQHQQRNIVFCQNRSRKFSSFSKFLNRTSMLQIDFIEQIDPRLSKWFRTIRFKKGSFCQKVVFAGSKWSENGLQSTFWNIFYTKPNYFFITKSLETAKLSGKVDF